MTEVDVVAQKEDKQQFADIFLLLISIESFVAFEFIPYIRQLFVDSLDFCLFRLAFESDEQKTINQFLLIINQKINDLFHENNSMHKTNTNIHPFCVYIKRS